MKQYNYNKDFDFDVVPVWYVFKDNEVVAKAFDKDEVAEFVKHEQLRELTRNEMSGKVYHAKYWAVPVTECARCVGANGEFNNKWINE